MGPRGFSVGMGTLYVNTEFHTYWWNVAQGLLFKVPVGGATKNRNTNFGMWVIGTSLHVSCEFHIHNYYGLRTVIYPDTRACGGHVVFSIDLILIEQLELWYLTATEWVPLKSNIVSMSCGVFCDRPHPFRCHALFLNMLTLSCSEFDSEQLLYWGQHHRRPTWRWYEQLTIFEVSTTPLLELIGALNFIVQTNP